MIKNWNYILKIKFHQKKVDEKIAVLLILLRF